MEIPDFALVILIGASGSGKSTFARKHFLPTEILSSDTFRGLVSDDETSLAATTDAFEALHNLADIRLRRRRLTVVDATNVQDSARKPLLELARKRYAVTVAIVLDVPPQICHERNASRPDRDFGKHVVERHSRDLKRSLKGLKREGWRYVFHLDSPERIENAAITRVPLWNDKRTETGPFDLIGDIHGCHDELVELLEKLGYAPGDDNAWRHPEGRRLLFLGDLVDRGPKVVESARLVMDTVENGAGFCVPGNHDDKLMRALQGKNVQKTHGLDVSLEQIDALPDEEKAAFSERFTKFVDGLISHLWLDGGALVAVHAGLPEPMIGRASSAIREFALYGDSTGQLDARGLPIRRDWAAEYRGAPAIVYGHTPVRDLAWRNNTMNLDTGCVFGGKLAALRWPEKTTVTVDARAVYREAPWLEDGAADSLDASPTDDNFLSLSDFSGRLRIETERAGTVTIGEGNAAAALEVISRFSANPRWLIYLPPTMSPVETSAQGGFLERPEEAFAYFEKHGVETVICEEKHMGSRAVVIACKTPDVAKTRFGGDGVGRGVILTRTGRPFFDKPEWNDALISDTVDAMELSGLWSELDADWVCLDAELLPWNAKAGGLLREQYAPVAAAGLQSVSALATAAKLGADRGIDGLGSLAALADARLLALTSYRDAYRRYCRKVESVSDITLAPFHLLAAGKSTFFDRDHSWHMATLARLAEASPRFLATRHTKIDLTDCGARDAGAAWWDEITGAGGEGMVVKPLSFLPTPRVQPALKVRGREYLRIIYGPEYDLPENLNRLRARGLNSKRALASREFALGLEGLTRFTAGDTLRRVHECAFGVLALESEPVDPRL